MKIRNRITTTFTILTGSIILVTFLIVIVFSYKERNEFFQNQLSNRIEITEKFFLENESASSETQEKLKENFNKRLPLELELVVEKPHLQDSLNQTKWSFIPTALVSELKNNESIFFTSNGFKGKAVNYNINNNDYIVLVLAKDTYGIAYLNKLKTWMIITLVLSILFAFIISSLLAKQILKPIKRKINKANKIEANNLSERLHVYNTNDEIGMLAGAFNNMLDRLESSFELQQNFVRYASHELKNPLAVIMGESEILLSKERTMNEYITTTDKIHKEAEKLNKLVNQFLSLSKVKAKNIVKEEVRIDELIFELILYFKQTHYNLDIELNLDEKSNENDWLTNANYELLKNAFQNIIENAIKFSDEKPIQLNLSHNKQQIIISIKDNGPGIIKGDEEKIFEPLYRSNKTKHIEGSGLGLSIVKNIIIQHDGEIKLKNSSSNGAEFIILLNKAKL